jgi:chromosomal replication initiation ATPase DnaA
MTNEQKYFTLDVISSIIQKKHKVDSSYIFQNTRQRDVCDLRKVFFYMAKEFTTLSLQCIGDYSKYRGRGESHNHATVLYSTSAVKDWMSVDIKYKEYIDDLANEIKFYVDYEQYQLDECNKYKKGIVKHIYNTIF